MKTKSEKHNRYAPLYMFLWGGAENPNQWQVKEITCGDRFVCVQILRLVMNITLLTSWFIILYILARQSLFYVSFWASTMQLIGNFLLSMSAGRLVVEDKIVKELNDKKAEKEKAKIKLLMEK